MLENSELVYQIKDDDILYFDHIPKAAGTTFANILDQHFDFETIYPEQLYDNLLPTLPKDLTKYKLFRGHFAMGLVRILPKKPLIVTMLREPIARNISWYDFVCATAENDPKVNNNLWDKSFSLSMILSNPEKNKSFINNETRFLSKDLPPSFYHQQIREQWQSVSKMFESPVDSNDLEIAKKNLSEFVFFGLTERFEDSILLLCYTFCWRPIRKVIKKMIGTHKHSFKDIPEDTRKTLEEMTNLDAELFKFAQELFEIRFNKMVQELKKRYYEPRFGEMPFHEMIFEMLEKHYEENYDKPITNNIDYNFRESLDGSVWQPREKDKEGIFFRWMGEEPAEFDIPLLEKRSYIFQVSYAHIGHPDCLKELKIKINNNLIKMKRLPGRKIFEGIIPTSFLNHKKKFNRITLQAKNTVKGNKTGEYVAAAPHRIRITPNLEQ